MRQLKITKILTQRTEGSINRYFNEISRISLISPEEEVELSSRIRRGDEKALNKLVLANLRFVISVAKRYQYQGLSFPDLINEGNIGLLIAAHKFDETRGFKFISYAVWWIRQSIMQAICNHNRIIRLPINRLTAINKIRNAIPLLEQELQREPTTHEIADHLNMSHDDIDFIYTVKKRQTSLDKPIPSEYGNDINLYDLIRNNKYESPDSAIMTESTTRNINRALSKLSTLESDILSKIFGLNGNRVQSPNEIAAIYNITPERVRQIKCNGLGKLKALIGSKHYMIES
jgi:RNA polymerase primary sigma factor